MKKINVNEDACIGCGACVAVDPDHFAFNSEGHSSVISQDNLETSALQNAIESCPTGAINITDSTCKCGDDCQCGDDCKCDENCHCGDDCHC